MTEKEQIKEFFDSAKVYQNLPRNQFGETSEEDVLIWIDIYKKYRERGPVDIYNIELTKEDIEYSEILFKKWRMNSGVEWFRLSKEDKIMLLKYSGYYVKEGLVYGCKIVREDFSSELGEIQYNELREYIDEVDIKNILNYDSHGPGLWAMSFREAIDRKRWNSKPEKVIMVSYNLDDVIFTGIHIKAHKLTVVDLEPMLKYVTSR